MEENLVKISDSYVIFHDMNDYKYRIRCKTLLNIDFTNDKKTKESLTLVYEHNPFSIDNINNWILNNKKPFKLISNTYLKNTEKLKFICLLCNKEFEAPWVSIIGGRGCSKCNKWRIRTKEEFHIEFLEADINREYEIIGEYEGHHKKIEIKHLLCGKSWFISPTNFIMANKRCFYCNNNHPVSEDECLSRINEAHPQKFELMGSYNGWKKSCLFKCLDCGYISNKVPRDIVAEKHGCKECYYNSIAASGNSYWGGGTTTLYEYLRGKTQAWKIKIFQKFNNECAISGDKYNRVVHHVDYNFSDIVNECHKELNIKRKKYIGEYDESDLLSLGDLCLNKHNEKVCGIAVTSAIHNSFHKMYGTRKNTREQFLEFALSKGKDLRQVI